MTPSPRAVSDQNKTIIDISPRWQTDIIKSLFLYYQYALLFFFVYFLTMYETLTLTLIIVL